MKRDIIDSLMAGGLLSFLPIWEADTVEQLVIAMGMAIVVFMMILKTKERIETNEEESSRCSD